MSHDHLSSMIFFEVDPAGIAVLEFESDAPRPVYVNRKARGLEQSAYIAQGVVATFRLALAVPQLGLICPVKDVYRDTPLG